VLLVTVLAAALWARPLFMGETFLRRDHATATLPSRDFLGRSLREGRIPEWWPGVGLGTPFAASPAHGVMYPPAWIVGVLPPALGADVVLVLHALFGAVGIALLARRFGAGAAGERFAGGAFMASGYVQSIVVNAIPLLTLAWTPWVALAADRLVTTRCLRAGIFLSLAFAAQIASGDPAGIVTSLIVLAAVVVARAPSPRALLSPAPALVAGVVLAAVWLLPAFGLLGESQRAGGITFKDAAIWSLHPLRLLALVWPRLFGEPMDGARDLEKVLADTGGPGLDAGWAIGIYLGLPVLLAALAGARAQGGRILIAAALVMLVLALGRYTPVYAAWRWLFVPERLVRYPEKHLAGALVLVCALAGVGLSRLLDRPPRWFWVAVGGAGSSFGVALGVLWIPRAHWIEILEPLARPRDVAGALGDSFGGGAVALTSLVVFVAAFAVRRRPHIGWLTPALAVLGAITPMVGESWRLQALGDRDVVVAPPSFLVPHVIPPGRGGGWARLYRSEEGVQLYRSDSSTGMIADIETALPDVATMHDVAYVPGYDPALPSRLKLLWDALNDRGAGARLLTLLGVKWAILPTSTARMTALVPIAVSADGRVVLVENPAHRPRGFVTDRWRRLPDDETVRAELAAPGPFDPWQVRLVGPGPDATPGTTSPRPCAVAMPVPEEVALSCTAERPALAVLVDAWAPGWSARVDGRPATIERVDSVLRGVFIPAGTHEITFAYRTPGLRLGLGISALTAALLAAAAVFSRAAPARPRSDRG
jgi:hypothetical protein